MSQQNFEKMLEFSKSMSSYILSILGNVDERKSFMSKYPNIFGREGALWKIRDAFTVTPFSKSSAEIFKPIVIGGPFKPLNLTSYQLRLATLLAIECQNNEMAIELIKKTPRSSHLELLKSCIYSSNMFIFDYLYSHDLPQDEKDLLMKIAIDNHNIPMIDRMIKKEM